MTRRDAYDCDKCGKETKSPTSLFVRLRRVTDAAGSGGDAGDDVDLCPTCAGVELARFVEKIRYSPEAQEFLARVKHPVKPH